MDISKEQWKETQDAVLEEQKEIKRKKKDSEAVFYFQAVVDEKIQKVKISRQNWQIVFGSNTESKKLMPQLAVAYKEGQYLLALAGQIRKRKETFVGIEPASEKYKELKNSLGKYKMSINDFNTIIMWSAKDDKDDLIHYINGDKKVSKERIAEVKKTAIESTAYLFDELDSGNAKPMADELAKALKTSMNKYGSCKTKEEAVQWSAHTEDIVNILSAHPEIEKETGLSKEEIDLAKHVANMGQTIKKGMDAIEKMAKAALENQEELPESEKLLLMNDVLNMSVAMNLKEQTLVLAKEAQNASPNINK